MFRHRHHEFDPAVTRRIAESIPAEWPTDFPDGTTWQRIESFIAYRYAVRDVVFLVDGPGPWLPPLAPVTITTFERWDGSGYEAVMLPATADGGYFLHHNRLYRFTGTAGTADPVIPPAVTSAYTRLKVYTDAPAGTPGASEEMFSIDVMRKQIARDPAHVAKALQNSARPICCARTAAFEKSLTLEVTHMINPINWFRRAPALEKRSVSSGFTAELMQAREAWISGRRGIAELTATAQSCVSLWENSFSLADVRPAGVIDRCTMALIGRSLALRGESVWYIADGTLTPCSDWDLRTRFGRPTAYRLSIPEAGGGESITALASFTFGSGRTCPFHGLAQRRSAGRTSRHPCCTQSSRRFPRCSKML